LRFRRRVQISLTATQRVEESGAESSASSASAGSFWNTVALFWFFIDSTSVSVSRFGSLPVSRVPSRPGYETDASSTERGGDAVGGAGGTSRGPPVASRSGATRAPSGTSRARHTTANEPLPICLSSSHRPPITRLGGAAAIARGARRFKRRRATSVQRQLARKMGRPRAGPFSSLPARRVALGATRAETRSGVRGSRSLPRARRRLRQSGRAWRESRARRSASRSPREKLKLGIRTLPTPQLRDLT
jgi:hypothetical protein